MKEKLFFPSQVRLAMPCFAFSLVEMLMALLVASLLMVALAPVITKKFSENLSISSIGGTRADYKRTWYYDPAKTYHEWSVPNGVNVIKVTAIGGGGAGGGASFGSREFTSDTTWTVPTGVTKLRVFMVGGGGAGAAGGAGSGVAKATVGTTTSSTGITSGSEWTIPADVKGNVPALDTRCTGKWKYNGTPSFDVEGNSTIVTVLAIGGGGGGGGHTWSDLTRTGGGGSGGKASKKVVIPPTLSKVPITIGGGGGYGSSNDIKAGYADAGKSANGGGGGCEANSASFDKACWGIGDNLGGRGGRVIANCIQPSYQLDAESASGTTGSGIAGVGYKGTSYACFAAAGNGSLEGGGGGGGASSAGGGGGGGGATFFGRYAYSTSTDKDFFLVAGGGGGGGGDHPNAIDGGHGGGGGGGAGGGAGGSSAVGNSYGRGGSGGNNAQGNVGGKSPYDNTATGYGAGGSTSSALDSASESGKNGYIKVSWAKEVDILECTYNQAANGGGGGGAGQVWFREISLGAGSSHTLTIKVGKGGTPSTVFGGNGGNGEATSIKVDGSTTYEVLGGEGGKYIDIDSNIADSAGAGRGLKSTNLVNWMNITDLSTKPAGLDGSAGKLVVDEAAGGAGGSTIDRFGASKAGGLGGNAQDKGKDSANYGAGGGGGGGVTDDGANPGLGGKGGAGYVYIEWGGTNGGGGASGQVITQESIWVTPGTIVKIYPGKGGTAPELTVQKDGSVEQGYKGENGPDGGDTYLIVKDASAEKQVGTAKGGKGGFAGAATHGRGGGIKVDGSGNYDPDNIQPEIENSTPGATATATEGGMGGTLTEEMCPLLTELKKVGLGGCGGNASSGGACLSAASVSGAGVNAGGLGNGGGGGAVVEVAGVKTPYKGGNGSSGMVTIEWSN